MTALYWFLGISALYLIAGHLQRNEETRLRERRMVQARFEDLRKREVANDLAEVREQVLEMDVWRGDDHAA